MKKFLNKYKYLLLTFLVSFVIFYPSLFMFFTNDDFFFLKVSQANSFSQFINFFNLVKGPEGFGMYRPLTTQVFYFLSWKFFGLNPLPLHIVSFAFFFAIIYLIYKIIIELTKNKKVALISSFLYAVSATHFGQLYYLAAFQELGMTLFVLLSCLMFIKSKNFLSFVFFVLALMSKETAVVTPVLIGLIYFYQKSLGIKVPSFKKLIINLLPCFLVLAIYFLFRIWSYGFATGDSYVWDFSIRKFLNTSFWYLFWSLNIPESLVDFVGPGLKVNPNIFVYWGNEIVPILVLSVLQLCAIFYTLLKPKASGNKSLILFCAGWFLVSLLPVIFLPFHKFTFYLTLPIIGIVFRLSHLFVTSKINKFVIGAFLIVWTATSVLTLKFTYETNWITQSELVSQRVFEFFKREESKYKEVKIVFTDTDEDSVLPWSPTSVVRTILSSDNFFAVFYPELASNVFYTGTGGVTIRSRQFLGY